MYPVCVIERNLEYFTGNGQVDAWVYNIVRIMKIDGKFKFVFCQKWISGFNLLWTPAGREIEGKSSDHTSAHIASYYLSAAGFAQLWSFWHQRTYKLGQAKSHHESDLVMSNLVEFESVQGFGQTYLWCDVKTN